MSKKNSTKRLLALSLSMFMLFSLVPMGAFNVYAAPNDGEIEEITFAFDFPQKYEKIKTETTDFETVLTDEGSNVVQINAVQWLDDHNNPIAEQYFRPDKAYTLVLEYEFLFSKVWASADPVVKATKLAGATSINTTAVGGGFYTEKDKHKTTFFFTPTDDTKTSLQTKIGADKLKFTDKTKNNKKVGQKLAIDAIGFETLAPGANLHFQWCRKELGAANNTAEVILGETGTEYTLQPVDEKKDVLLRITDANGYYTPANDIVQTDIAKEENNTAPEDAVSVVRRTADNAIILLAANENMEVAFQNGPESTWQWKPVNSDKEVSFEQAELEVGGNLLVHYIFYQREKATPTVEASPKSKKTLVLHHLKATKATIKANEKDATIKSNFYGTKEKLTLTADAPDTGKIFSKWTFETGGQPVKEIVNPYKEYQLPGSPTEVIKVKANYVNKLTIELENDKLTYTGAENAPVVKTQLDPAEYTNQSIAYIGRGATDYALNTTAPTEVGTYQLVLKAEKAGEQYLALADFEIGQKSVELTVDDITAPEYDCEAQEPAITVKTDEVTPKTLILTTDYTVEYKDNINATTDDKKAQVIISPVDGSQYKFTKFTKEFEIKKKAGLTITVDAKSRGYGKANPEFTAVVTNAANDDEKAVIEENIIYTCAADEKTAVGTDVDIVATIKDNPIWANYEAPIITNAKLSIAKAAQIVLSDIVKTHTVSTAAAVDATIDMSALAEQYQISALTSYTATGAHNDVLANVSGAEKAIYDPNTKELSYKVNAETDPVSVKDKTASLECIFASINYDKVVLKVVINTTDKQVPNVSVDDFEKVYDGKTVKLSDLKKNDAGIKGSWDMDFSAKDADVYGDAAIKFIPEDKTKYSEKTCMIKITIKKAEVTGEPVVYPYETGEGGQLGDVPLLSNTLTPAGKSLKWKDESLTVEKGKEYEWVYDAGNNYNVKTGKLVAYDGTLSSYPILKVTKEISKIYDGEAFTVDDMASDQYKNNFKSSETGEWQILTTGDLTNAGERMVELKFTPKKSTMKPAYEEFKLIISKKIPEGNPECNYLTAAAPLKMAQLRVGEITEPGKIKWDDPENTLVVKEHKYPWTFTPEDTDNYEIRHGEIIVWGDRDHIKVSAKNIEKVFDGKAITKDDIQGESGYVKGKWSFKDSTVDLTNVGVRNVELVFKPNKSDKYYPAETTIQINITKAKAEGAPAITVITTAGKTLADANLNKGTISVDGTITWRKPLSTKVLKNGWYTWIFTPKDKNYQELSGILQPFSDGSNSHPDADDKENQEGGGSGGSGSGGSGGSGSGGSGGSGSGGSGGSGSGGSGGSGSKHKYKDDDDDDKYRYRDKKKEKNKPAPSVKDKNKNTNKNKNNSIYIENNGINYIDVITGAWYSEGVEFVLKTGLMNGTAKNQFSPQLNITRAMLITILHRYAGLEAPSKTSHYFTDINEKTWYSDAAHWGKEQNIIDAFAGGKFGGEKILTREELVLMIYRFAVAKNLQIYASDNLMAYSDVNEIAPEAVKAFNWAVANGIVNGTGNGLLSPKATTTRAEVAIIFMRLNQKFGYLKLKK